MRSDGLSKKLAHIYLFMTLFQHFLQDRNSTAFAINEKIDEKDSASDSIYSTLGRIGPYPPRKTRKRPALASQESGDSGYTQTFRNCRRYSKSSCIVTIFVAKLGKNDNQSV
jgi:hypothetical protein